MRSVCVGFWGRGRKSWDKLKVERPVSVVGAVDAPSEDSEMVDSSKLRPTIAGCTYLLDGGGRRVKRKRKCAAIVRRMFLESALLGQQTLGSVRL